MPKKGQTWKWSIEARRRFSEKKKGQATKIPLEARSRKYKTNDRRIKKCFHWMHSRCLKNGRQCDFPRTEAGFNLFCKELGPIPDTVSKASVGRRDHDYGYIIGNIFWEEYKENVWKTRQIEDKRKKQSMAEEIQDDIPF